MKLTCIDKIGSMYTVGFFSIKREGMERLFDILLALEINVLFVLMEMHWFIGISNSL